MKLVFDRQRKSFTMVGVTLMSNKDADLLQKSDLYHEFQAEKSEILRYKWLKSEKAGRDIGFDRAFLDWILFHRDQWRCEHRQKKQAFQS